MIKTSTNDHVLKTTNYRKYKNDFKKHLCDCKDIENNINAQYKSSRIETFDTLTNNDVVRNQYSNLPYPAVTFEELNIEKSYYDNMQWPVKAYGKLRNKPFRVTPGITLEAINHYLFRGKNDFRYMTQLRWHYE